MSPLRMAQLSCAPRSVSPCVTSHGSFAPSTGVLWGTNARLRCETTVRKIGGRRRQRWRRGPWAGPVGCETAAIGEREGRGYDQHTQGRRRLCGKRGHQIWAARAHTRVATTEPGARASFISSTRTTAKSRTLLPRCASWATFSLLSSPSSGQSRHHRRINAALVA